MRTYPLHLPPEARPGDAAALDEAALVRDGFSVGAFLFGFLWFFAHGLWLAGIAVLAAFAALAAAGAALSVSPGAIALAWLLLAWLVGMEAGSLRHWTYARHGRPVAAVVAADDEEEATLKAFTHWLGDRDGPHRAAAPAGWGGRPAYAAPEGVLGLFPDAERSR